MTDSAKPKKKFKAVVLDPQGAVKKEQPKLLPQPFVNQLRSIVSSKDGKRASWMQFLDDTKLSEIYRLFKLGKSAIAVARKVQDEWHLFEDVRVKNLVPALTAFRREALGDIYDLPDFHYETKKQDALSVINALRKQGGDAVKGIDALAMLADVILLERGRLESRYAQEEITGEVDKGLTRDIQSFSTLLDTMAAMQHKLGLINYQTQPSATLHMQFNTSLEALPDGTVNLAKAAQVYMEKIKQLPSRQLVLRPDGSYAVSEEEA